MADRIEDLIRDESIRSGERLPSERELSTRLGVSRTALREAMIALELNSVVAVHSGPRVYVNLPRDNPDQMPERRRAV